MINFRYHLASLIAVFLALGLGIVAGSTFVSPETVRALSGTLKTIDASNRTLQDENNALAQTNRALLQFAQASRDAMVQGKLTGLPVVVVSFDSTPGAELSQMGSTLVLAGARLQGSIQLSSNLALADDASRQQAAIALGVGQSSADVLQATLVRELTDALSGRTPGVLQRLIDAGLASKGPGVAGDSPQPPAALATLGTAVVILTPAQTQPGAKPAPDLGRTVMLPLVRALSAAPVPLLAVGEDGSSPLPVLSPIRQDSSLRVVTVDNADLATGQAAVVLGLAAVSTSGLWGAYGSGPGAGAPLPTPLSTPAVSSTATAGPTPTPSKR